MSLAIDTITDHETLIEFIEFLNREVSSLPDDALYTFSLRIDPLHKEAGETLDGIVDKWNKAKATQVVPASQGLIGANYAPNNKNNQGRK